MNQALASGILDTAFKAFCALGTLLIGSLIVAKAMERYKARMTILVALSAARAKKIEDVATQLFDLEHGIEHMAAQLKAFEKRAARTGRESLHEWTDKYLELYVPLEKEKEKVRREIKISYFLLGRKLSDRLNHHFELLSEYSVLLNVEDTHEKARECWFKIEANRPSVLDFMRNPEE